MKQIEMLAMILAGGRGSRLLDLTNQSRLSPTVANTALSISRSATARTAVSTLSVF